MRKQSAYDFEKLFMGYNIKKPGKDDATVQRATNKTGLRDYNRKQTVAPKPTYHPVKSSSSRVSSIDQTFRKSSQSNLHA